MSKLPEPDSAAREHSAALVELIRAVIRAEGGAIAFSRYMELALYAPGLGYYSAGAQKFGRAGDFVTAPELGPLFAQCVAEAVAPVLGQLNGARFLELGGGSGAFAQDVLIHLALLDAVPQRYDILEPSADLRERQRALDLQASRHCAVVKHVLRSSLLCSSAALHLQVHTALMCFFRLLTVPNATPLQ